MTSASWSRDGAVLAAEGGVTLSDETPPTTAIVWGHSDMEPRTFDLADAYGRPSTRGERRWQPPRAPASRPVGAGLGLATRAPVGPPLRPAALLGRDPQEVTALAFSNDAALLAIGTAGLSAAR